MQRRSTELNLLDINHSIIAINTSHGHLWGQNTSASSLQQFSSNLRANGLVTLDEQQVQKRLSLILGNIVPVPLGKGKETLMPQHRKLFSALDGHRSIGHGILIHSAEAQKVEHKRIHDFVGQSVLLLEQDTDENVCRTTSFEVIGHLLGGDFAQAVDGCCRVQNGDTDADEDGTDDVGFAECAGARSEEREQEALEETGGLVEGLFECFVEVDV